MYIILCNGLIFGGQLEDLGLEFDPTLTSIRRSSGYFQDSLSSDAMDMILILSTMFTDGT